jgi:hypothetical protein
MALRSIQPDETLGDGGRVRAARLSGIVELAGMGEVGSALELLRPTGSLIRDAREESINVPCPSDERGRSTQRCVFIAARPATPRRR